MVRDVSLLNTSSGVSGFDAGAQDWLRESIQGRFLIAWFQPIVDVRTRDVVGFEALARAWRDGTAVAPSVFIALAKAEDLIDQLGEVVLAYSLNQAGRLPGESSELGVNFSARQLAEPTIVARLLQAAEQRSFHYERLVVEVSEKALSSAEAIAFTNLERIRSLGFQVVVDDFSSQSLSIESIAALGATGVKISRRVIDAVVENETAATLVDKLCTEAHRHDLQTTAVGVERAEHMNLVRGLGCDRAQGFFTGRPLPIDEAAALRHRRGW